MRIASSRRSTPSAGDVGRQLGLVEAHRHERDGGQVVHLVGLCDLDGTDQARQVAQVALHDLDVRDARA